MKQRRDPQSAEDHPPPKLPYQFHATRRSMLAEFSVTPIGKGVGVGDHVARCLDIVDKSGMPYKLTPMGTIVEGGFDAVLRLIAKCHKAVARDCDRVSTLIKIDDRKGARRAIEAKVASVEKRLGRRLRT